MFTMGALAFIIRIGVPLMGSIRIGFELIRIGFPLKGSLKLGFKGLND